MSINLFVPTFKVDEVLDSIRDCLEKGWTGLGYKTVEFEEKFKEYTQLANVHFLTSNTVGLHLALHILKEVYGWLDTDEVISTPLTFIATNHAILHARLRPVFADVDDSLCLDPASVKSRITPRTRAVMFVGMGGNIGNYAEIVDLCRAKGLKLILDAAHMAGTKVDGRQVGSDADVVVFSFQAVKNLPTADAGAICFADDSLDKMARELSWLGINKDTYQRFHGGESGYKWKYDVNRVGFKYHGNSIQAAIGLVQLKYLDQGNERRNQISSIYDELLGDLKEVQRIPLTPNCYSSRALYQVAVNKRDILMQHFYDNDIFPGVHYADNTEYPMYSYASGTCPHANAMSKKILSLPNHLRLTDEDCQQVVKVFKSGVEKFLR